MMIMPKSGRWRKYSIIVLDTYGPTDYAQHYANTNYVHLTAIIEASAGSTVSDEFERYFFDPIKLENTFVSVGEEPPVQNSVAHSWVDLDRDGNLDDLHGIQLT